MAQKSGGGLGNIGSDFFNNIQLAFRLYMDPRVSLVMKALVPVLALGYFVLPVDFLPDVVPILGQLDDVAVLLLAMRMFISLAPSDVVSEHRAAMAGNRGQGADAASAASTAGTGFRADQTADDVVDADYRVMNDG